MSRLRRPTFLSVFFDRRPLVDVGAILAGRFEVEHHDGPVAVSLLDGKEHLLSTADLDALARIPSSGWTAYEDAVARLKVRPEVLDQLVGRGLLLSDVEGGPGAELTRRDAALARQGWERHAAVYHFTSRWPVESETQDLGDRSVSIQEAVPETEEVLDRSVEEHGPPPGAFLDRGAPDSLVPLPRVSAEGELFEVLAERRTTRLFDRDRLLGAEQLSTVLGTVFGCSGTARLSRHLEVLRKTSPSGGALHPVEVYPLVCAVEGFEPGLYHYSVRRHGLEPLSTFATAEEAREVAESFVRGQRSLCSAHVLFVLTGRFYRTFWKYRRHQKAYRVLYLDVGHLSQTLYLVSTVLGLGAFFTGAISEMAIDETLGLDWVEEGALAVCGCGVKPADGLALSLETVPYSEPRVDAPEL